MKFTCQVRIIDFDTSFGWWYKACAACKSSVKIYDDIFLCSNCNQNEQAPIPWYKLHTVVEDSTGCTNFTIFGKAANDLIRIPARILANLPGSDQFTLPPVIKAIIGQQHVFQIVLDAQRFRSSTVSFKVLKIFPLNRNTKDKSTAVQDLLMKHEERLQSPSTNKEIDKDLFTDVSPNVETSSSSEQFTHDLSEIHHPKKLRLMFDEAAPSNKEIK